MTQKPLRKPSNSISSPAAAEPVMLPALVLAQALLMATTAQLLAILPHELALVNLLLMAITALISQTYTAHPMLPVKALMPQTLLIRSAQLLAQEMLWPQVKLVQQTHLTTL